MIVEQVHGNVLDLPAGDLAGRHVEKVILPLAALTKRVQRVTSDHGREFGIRLAPDAPGLREGDILVDEGADLVVVALEPTDVLIIAPDSLERMGVVAHNLGNRHLPAQFFPAEVSFPEIGAHQGVMVIEYDHTAEHYLEQAGVRFVRSSRVMAQPFRHAEHTH